MAKLSYSLDPNKLNLSHSIRETLHRCPRLFQITVLNNHGARKSTRKSVIFGFGHAVGAGIQALLGGKGLPLAIIEALANWDVPDLFEDDKGRNFGKVILALELFSRNLSFLEGWEVAFFTDSDGNTRSGIEFDFLIELENDATYQGHIDAVLYSRSLNQFMVVELKTTGAYREATYYNSTQTLGYSLVLDYILDSMKDMLQLDDEAIASAKSLNQVLYFVFDIKEEQWVDLPLRQSAVSKTDFLMDVDADVEFIKKYQLLGFFPKRGGSCMKYNSECQFFKSCDLGGLTNHKASADTSQFGEESKPAIYIKLEDLLQQQIERAKSEFYATNAPDAIPDIILDEATDGDGYSTAIQRDSDHFAI